MNSRELGFWTLQSLAVCLFVVGGGWGAYQMSSHTQEDNIAVVRTPFVSQPSKDEDGLAWRFTHEGIADAVRDTRPDPYVPAEPESLAPDPVIPTESAAEALPAPEEAVAQIAAESAWAAPLAAALKSKPRRAAPTRSVLKMISLGPASSGFSVGGSASYAAPAARAESAGPSGPAAVAQETAAAEAAPQATRHAVPSRRAFVSAAPSPSAPPSGSAFINQLATDYGNTETAPD